MNILIVEDDMQINDLLYTLLSKNYQVYRAYSGTEALLNHQLHHIDLVILDLMLPGMTGEELLPIVIKNSKVIILSAKDSQSDKISTLLHGANDYITKPFDNNEFLARVEVQLRADPVNTTQLRIGDLSIDTKAREAYILHHQLKLTKLEYDILLFLMKHKNQVFSKSHIFERVWDSYSIGNEDSVKVHISNLRTKIGEYTDAKYIETVWGIGFRIVDKL